MKQSDDVTDVCCDAARTLYIPRKMYISKLTIDAADQRVVAIPATDQVL